MPNCPVPGSNHGNIPDGQTLVGTLVNVVNHLAEKDTAYLEGRCYQLLADLGVEVSAPTTDTDVGV